MVKVRRITAKGFSYLCLISSCLTDLAVACVAVLLARSRCFCCVLICSLYLCFSVV